MAATVLLLFRADRLRLHTPPQRKELGAQLPGLPVIVGFFPRPSERIFRNVAEAPPDAQRTIFIEPFLDDLIPHFFSNQLVLYVADRIDPGDAPGFDARVVRPQRCPIPVSLFRKPCRALFPRRNDENILNGAPFQHPSEMPLSTAFVGRSVIVIVQLPMNLGAQRGALHETPKDLIPCQIE